MCNCVINVVWQYNRLWCENRNLEYLEIRGHIVLLGQIMKLLDPQLMLGLVQKRSRCIMLFQFFNSWQRKETRNWSFLTKIAPRNNIFPSYNILLMYLVNLFQIFVLCACIFTTSLWEKCVTASKYVDILKYIIRKGIISKIVQFRKRMDVVRQFCGWNLYSYKWNITHIVINKLFKTRH